ncbi:MAG: hypothetical protein IT430_00115 [Phycisphaerales bacterium]|nr:hypothetical protein [Phycisphaerales bacterium]
MRSTPRWSTWQAGPPGVGRAVRGKRSTSRATREEQCSGENKRTCPVFLPKILAAGLLIAAFSFATAVINPMRINEAAAIFIIWLGRSES